MSDEDAAAMIRSAAAQRGHFTRALKQLEVTLDEIRKNPTWQGRTIIDSELNKVSMAHDKAVAAYDDVIKYSPANAKTAIEACDLMGNDKTDIHAYAMKAIIECNDMAQQPLPQHIPGQNNNQSIRVVQALRPDTLTRDSTPAELRLWIEAYTAYYRASKMDTITVEEQQAFWYRCLDLSLETTLRQRILPQSKIFGRVNSCMSNLQDLFYELYPIFTRRRAYFEYTQARGQHINAFYAKLLALAEEADLDTLTKDEIHMYRVISGISDDKLRKQLLKLENPTKKLMEQEIAAYLRVNRSQAAARGDVKVHKISTRNRFNKNRQPQRNRRPSSKCYACGRQGHRLYGSTSATVPGPIQPLDTNINTQQLFVLVDILH